MQLTEYNVTTMPKAVIYTNQTCPYCIAAKSLLARHGYEIVENDVRTNSTCYQEMIALRNRRTVPQIVIEDEYIGGYEELTAWLFTNTASTGLE